MNDPWREWTPPHPHWDTVLRLVPTHIFIFDTELVCRYAAPTGDAFLGRSRDQLTGRHAVEILPPASDGLRPMLERAVQEAVSWSAPHYRFSHRDQDAETIHIWAVQVEPLVLRSHRGVLLTLHDVLDLVEERDQLRLDNSACQDQLNQLDALVKERDREILAFGAKLRTLLTSVWGYLQILSRRPWVLRQRSTAEALEELVLPEVNEIAQTIDDLEHLPSPGPEQR